MKRWFLRIGTFFGIVLIIALAWLFTTDHSWVWPRRNYFHYQALTRWWGLVGEPQTGALGELQGHIQDEQGQPIEGAWVVLSRWNGATYTDQSNAEGRYHIQGIPGGRYWPVVGASGYVATLLEQRSGAILIEADSTVTRDVRLSGETRRQIMPGVNLTLGEPSTKTCEIPLTASAQVREVTFEHDGQPNQLTLFYTPVDAEADTKLPLLLAVYPGPADTWACASIPLAAAGYAVIGVGPAYNLELENDIDDLERLLDFAHNQAFPFVDPTRVGVLGGSYSGLHVQWLFQRGREDIQAAVLLGAPTDIYTMRHLLEAGTFKPPFGLDLVLISLGLPDRQPMRYFQASGIYHVTSQTPPTLIIHSRDDAIVPVDQSDLLVQQLANVGVPYQVHYFDEASHYLLHPGGESKEIYDLTVTFLQTWLGG